MKSTLNVGKHSKPSANVIKLNGYMNSTDIWTKLYDMKITNDSFELNEMQTNLFFLIDLIYYVENGGVTGFLYNKTPTKAHEDLFKPYSKSLGFFGHSQIVDLLNKYNQRYWEAFEKYNRDKNHDFNLLLDSFDMQSLEQELESLIHQIADNQENIYDWIENHKNDLIENII